MKQIKSEGGNKGTRSSPWWIEHNYFHLRFSPYDMCRTMPESFVTHLDCDVDINFVIAMEFCDPPQMNLLVPADT